MVNEAMQNNANPQLMLQQVMGNMSNKDKENLFKQCKGYGVPDNILSQVQNMK